MLPVYSGTRYQRGGGILSSIARFVLPTAKKFLSESIRAAPTVVDSILNKKWSPGQALLGGLKAAGRNTLNQVVRSQPKRIVKRKQQQQVHRRRKKRRKHNDVFDSL